LDHVNVDGLVNYSAMKSQRRVVDDYLVHLEKNRSHLTADASSAKAYWINFYNAATIQIVLSRYPIRSLRDIPTKRLGHETIWEVPLYKVNGRKYSLNQIERELLLSRFNDPGIHFALVCAARSCPPLRRELYDSSRVDEQIRDQARIFLTDRRWNHISETKASLSPLFDWYRADFQKSGSLNEVLSSYLGVPVAVKDITYKDYDWSLNATESK
jgi:hypothetical protein